MSDKDKSKFIEFQFIERPSSSSSIVKLWVLIEGFPDPVELKADITNVKNLNDFKEILIAEFADVLGNVKKQSIVLLDDNIRVLPDVELQKLADNSTARKPLVVRYPLSSSSIKVNLRFVNRKEECRIEHTSGSFDMLQIETKAKFEGLVDCEPIDIYFEHQNSAEKIENKHHFNYLVKKCRQQDHDDFSFDLKVLVRNRKSYGDWKDVGEVLKKVFHKEHGDLAVVQVKFDMEQLPRSCPELSAEVQNNIVEQLKVKKNVFVNVNTNEATTREFISVILANTINFVKMESDNTAELMVEKQLFGSCGYGPLDYAVMLQTFYILITEAKPKTVDTGIARNLVQIHSASEAIRKRKLDQAEFETMPIIGIVTTGRTWLFIRYTPGINQIEISEEFECCFTGSMDGVKDVASRIVRLLQAQVKELKNQNTKRQCVNN